MIAARCTECGGEAYAGRGPSTIRHDPDCTEAPLSPTSTGAQATTEPTALGMAQASMRHVERLGERDDFIGGAAHAQKPYFDAAVAYALVSIAESLDKLVGIPPCPHCGSRAGATAWDAVEVDEHDPATWHRRCAACGGVLPEYER